MKTLIYQNDDLLLKVNGILPYGRGDVIKIKGEDFDVIDVHILNNKSIRLDIEITQSMTEFLREKREIELISSNQLTLGLFIDELEKPFPNKEILFDFGGLIPKPYSLHSYRGHYDELALDYKESNGNCTLVRDVLANCKQSLGQNYTGWKGGDFTMNEDTPLWVSHQGYSSRTAIVNVLDIPSYVIICTEYLKGE